MWGWVNLAVRGYGKYNRCAHYFPIKNRPIMIFKSRIKKILLERFVRTVPYIMFWITESPICMTLARCHLC